MKKSNKTHKKSSKRIVPEELTSISGGSGKPGPQTGATAPRLVRVPNLPRGG